MDIVLAYALLLALMEYFEMSWQKAGSLRQMIHRSYQLYAKNIFLFFAMHPGLYLLLFIVVLTQNYSFWLLFIIGIKATDVIFKLSLINRIYIKQDLPKELDAAMRQPVPSYMFFVPIVLYPLFLYLGLSDLLG
ncbi:MAG: hypothetical protein ACQERK_00185 [Campylobacterota bacterium]